MANHPLKSLMDLYPHQNQYTMDRNQIYRDRREHSYNPYALQDRYPRVQEKTNPRLPQFNPDLSEQMSIERAKSQEIQSVMAAAKQAPPQQYASSRDPSYTPAYDPWNPPSKQWRQNTLNLMIDKFGIDPTAARKFNESGWDIADIIGLPMWVQHGKELSARAAMEGDTGMSVFHAAMALLPLPAMAAGRTGLGLAGGLLNKAIKRGARATPFDKLSRMEYERAGVKPGQYKGGPETWMDQSGRVGGVYEPQIRYQPKLDPPPRTIKRSSLEQELESVINEAVPRGRPQRGQKGRSRNMEAFGRMLNTKWPDEELNAGRVMVARGRDPYEVATYLDERLQDPLRITMKGTSDGK